MAWGNSKQILPVKIGMIDNSIGTTVYDARPRITGGVTFATVPIPLYL